MIPKNRPIVGVMGSGHSYEVDSAEKLGCWLASIGVNLLTGGGQGVMEGVSKSFANHDSRDGLVIGVVPGRFDAKAKKYVCHDGYPNPWVEIVIYTHLPWSGNRGTDDSSRNHINVLSADVIILLPGGYGTSSEAELAIRYHKPVIAWLEDRSQIPELNSKVSVVHDFGDVKKFVNSNI